MQCPMEAANCSAVISHQRTHTEHAKITRGKGREGGREGEEGKRSRALTHPRPDNRNKGRWIPQRSHKAPPHISLAQDCSPSILLSPFQSYPVSCILAWLSSSLCLLFENFAPFPFNRSAVVRTVVGSFAAVTSRRPSMQNLFVRDRTKPHK